MKQIFLITALVLGIAFAASATQRNAHGNNRSHNNNHSYNNNRSYNNNSMHRYNGGTGIQIYPGANRGSDIDIWFYSRGNGPKGSIVTPPSLYNGYTTSPYGAPATPYGYHGNHY